MIRDAAIYRLCLVTDRRLAPARRALADIVAAAVRGGVTMVQLREKEATTRDFLDAARALKALLAPLRIPLIVNDRIDIALAVDADGVHVGQSDMPVREVRALIGAEKIVGLSIAGAAQIRRPDVALSDYLGIGPVFAQTTKGNASQPLGIAGFAALRALAPAGVPVMAIGGVKAIHAAALRAAGADGLAVVSAIMASADPEAAALGFG